MNIATARVALSTPVNLRDLGEIPIKDGVVRQGFAVRTDDLAYVTAGFAEALISDGLTAIIDLRSPAEVSTTGRGPFGTFPIAYHHLPLIADVANTMSNDRPILSHEFMGEIYVDMVRTAAPQLVTALNIIAHTSGITAFRCAAGRDRTGVLAAVLLIALGAHDDDVIVDYAHTGDNMPAILERTQPVMGLMWEALGFDHAAPDTTALLDGCMNVSMLLTLATLREAHGDPIAPLRDAGLSDATVARLHQRAVAG